MEKGRVRSQSRSVRPGGTTAVREAGRGAGACTTLPRRLCAAAGHVTGARALEGGEARGYQRLVLRRLGQRRESGLVLFCHPGIRGCGETFGEASQSVGSVLRRLLGKAGGCRAAERVRDSDGPATFQLESGAQSLNL